jgi:beta-lactamase superfamily II metal-dependent hydrolase
VIITHFHADHVDGLIGVNAAPSRVGQLWVSPLAPPGPLDGDGQAAGRCNAEFRVNRTSAGTRARVGEAEVQVLGPVEHVASRSG